MPCGSSVDPEVGPYLFGLIDFSYCTFSNPICESILAASGAFNADPSRASPTLRATPPTSSSPTRADGASIGTAADDDIDLGKSGILAHALLDVHLGFLFYRGEGQGLTPEARPCGRVTSTRRAGSRFTPWPSVQPS